MERETLEAILDSIEAPLLFADTDHIIRYMNRAAERHYEEGRSLIGRSLMDCHNERSRAVIVETLEALRGGEDERLITDNARHRIYMRAVRDAGGDVIGYYERYASPRGGAEAPGNAGAGRGRDHGRATEAA